jgi:hypothetical protein
VENVDVSLLKARANFSLKPGKELQPEVLRKAVMDAGFTPRDIFLTVRGKLIEQDGKPVFQPVGSNQLFSLVANAAATNLKTERLKEVGLVAKVVGEKPPLSLEIQQYTK